MSTHLCYLRTGRGLRRDRLRPGAANTLHSGLLPCKGCCESDKRLPFRVWLTMQNSLPTTSVAHPGDWTFGAPRTKHHDSNTLLRRMHNSPSHNVHNKAVNNSTRHDLCGIRTYQRSGSSSTQLDQKTKVLARGVDKRNSLVSPEHHGCVGNSRSRSMLH
jgi:hypothetical protein